MHLSTRVRSAVSVPILCTALSASAFALPQAVDTFEDLGADGTPVPSRVLEGITITLSNAGATPLTARTYGSGTDVAFTGAGGGTNVPKYPEQVSGTRFISASEGSDTFNTDAPIVFTLSEPVAAFGLTTLDLMESFAGTHHVVLRAFDGGGAVVAEHERNGDQDTSGATLLWRVASDVADIEEVHLLGQVPSNSAGYGIDDVFIRKDPIPPIVIEVSQESAPGVGDFDANVLGTIDSSDYFLTPQQYYSWFPTGTSFSGPGLTSSAGSSLSVFKSASTGERCVVMIHDRSEDGSGGTAHTRLEILGDTNGAVLLVEDDIDAQFQDNYSATPDNLVHTLSHSWDPCCTDGVVLGAMEGEWSVLVEFTSTPTGILTWSALSRDANPLALTLEIGRRVRLRSLEDPPPAGSGYCFGDGTGVACPCGNETTPGEGCGNSSGSGAILSGTGSPSVTADDLVLTATGVLPNQFGVMFTGPSQSEMPFGDGLLCIQGTLNRYPIQNSGPGAVMTEGPGLVAFSLANFPPSGHITPATTWRFQAWYRDPQGPCGTAFNLSNALEVLFGP